MKPSEPSNPFVIFRRELHRHPELSGKEFQTRDLIRSFIDLFTLTDVQRIGGTGLLVQYGPDAQGPVTLIRGDIDALPIQEVNLFNHRSVHPGVSHKCGHDGHATVLLRLASMLNATPIAKGRVYLLFQPAEETGQGAKAVLDDYRFGQNQPGGIRPDRIFALHNLPGFPEGTIVCKPGTFTLSVESLVVRFSGRVSHAAEPENGCNPAYVMAEFTLLTRELQNPNIDSDDYALITPIHTLLGGTPLGDTSLGGSYEPAYGVSAGYGEVHLTLRTRTVARMDALKRQLADRLNALIQPTHVRTEQEYIQAFAANENDSGAYEQVRRCAETLNFPFLELTQPLRWGEDFGLFTQRYRGAMFGIGAGETSPALHNEHYDFNDALLEPAARLFRALINLEHA